MQLLLNWQLFVQVSFIIIPVTHIGNSHEALMPDDESLHLHSGPPEGVYLDQDLGYINIQNMDTSQAKQLAEENSKKTGKDLQKWVDTLSNIGHDISELCTNTVDVLNICDVEFPRCDKTYWSTFYPDPKTDLSVLHS